MQLQYSNSTETVSKETAIFYDLAQEMEADLPILGSPLMRINDEEQTQLNINISSAPPMLSMRGATFYNLNTPPTKANLQKSSAKLESMRPDHSHDISSSSML